MYEKNKKDLPFILIKPEVHALSAIYCLQGDNMLAAHLILRVLDISHLVPTCRGKLLPLFGDLLKEHLGVLVVHFLHQPPTCMVLLLICDVNREGDVFHDNVDHLLPCPLVLHVGIQKLGEVRPLR